MMLDPDLQPLHTDVAKEVLGWGQSSALEHLPSVHELWLQYCLKKRKTNKQKTLHIINFKNEY